MMEIRYVGTGTDRTGDDDSSFRLGEWCFATVWSFGFDIFWANQNAPRDDTGGPLHTYRTVPDTYVPQ
jgi:hypothetical protein